MGFQMNRREGGETFFKELLGLVSLVIPHSAGWRTREAIHLKSKATYTINGDGLIQFTVANVNFTQKVSVQKHVEQCLIRGLDIASQTSSYRHLTITSCYENDFCWFFFFFHDKFHSTHTLTSIVTQGNFILHLLPLLSSSHFTKLSRS